MSPLRQLTGAPITNPQELAAVIAEIVRETARWDQALWWSSSFFRHADGIVPELDVAKARQSLNTGCQSTACVSGWSVILHAPAGSLIDVHDTVTLPSGELFFAATYGQLALALDDERATWLFDGKRTRTEVLFALDAIAASRTWTTDEGDVLPEPDADYADDDDDDYEDEDDDEDEEDDDY